MTDTPFKVGQTYRTRGGGTARVICVDRKGEKLPMVALHLQKDGTEITAYHHTNGMHSLFPKTASDFDLLPPDPPKPVRVRVWANVAAHDIRGVHPKREVAAAWCSNTLGIYQAECILTIPPDIASQCDWLKDAEIVHDD